MPIRQYAVQDPQFVEYCFHILKNVPRDRIAGLEVREQQIFRSEASIWKFAEGESLEKRLLLLARLGVQFSVVLGPQGNSNSHIWDEILKQHQDTKKYQELIEQMAKGKMFVFGSKDILMASRMAAQNSHLGLYVLDYTYLALNKKFDATRGYYSRNIKDAADTLDTLSKLVLNALTTDEVIFSIAGVDTIDMKLLLALYPYRNQYVVHENLVGLMNQTHRQKSLAKIVNKLKKSGHVDMIWIKERGRGGGRYMKYTILDAGINAVMEYLRFIAKRSILQ